MHNQYLKKLVLGASFFFMTTAHAEEIISVKFTFTGDLKMTADYTGPLGTTLPGALEAGETSPCETTALFRRSFTSQKIQIETWLHLLCGNKEQKVKFAPPRFYIDEKTSSNRVELKYLSEQFKHIQLTISDLKITTKKVKK